MKEFAVTEKEARRGRTKHAVIWKERDAKGNELDKVVFCFVFVLFLFCFVFLTGSDKLWSVASMCVCVCVCVCVLGVRMGDGGR